MILVWLLLIFITCALLSSLLCGIARKLFPKFRSGEYKPGRHRSDLPVMPASGREIKTIELPLVGGPAFTLAILATGIAAGIILKFSYVQWTLLLIGLGATFGYMLVGFIDDWHKVHSNEGLSERAKFVGVFSVSMAAAFLYYWLVPGGKTPYSPYSDIFGKLFYSVPLLWLIFLMLLTGVIGSVTSLSVDFSDGLDGLAGGLVFSTALAFGIIITGIINPHQPEGIVLELLSLLCASSVLGFLPWNWPSSWAARRGSARRRAVIYMGDSGALSLGGILAMIALLSRNELLLLMIGAAFVLEGLSALISAKLMTRFFRRHLQSLRFMSSHEYVPHTEFPLPFLATPLHHHFDLLGWDRRRLVYGAWALGACFAILGVQVGLDPIPWQRWVGRFLVLILAWIVWSSGSWTRRYFVGKQPAERTRRRRLALFYGFPFRLMGFRLYHLVEVIEASEDVIETPAEELALWQRMNIFDARAMLGLYCYRAGYYPAALAQWTRIPELNRALRPDIKQLLEELDSRLALEKQETQPMRRDQILRQPPVLTGNLAPADLPNPHEPIRSEETHSGRDTSGPYWGIPAMDDEDEEERTPTAPLHNESIRGSGSDPRSREEKIPLNGTTKGAQADEQTQGAIHRAPTPVAHKNWLARTLRPTSDKER